MVCSVGAQTRTTQLKATAETVELAIATSPSLIHWKVQRGAKSPEISCIIRKIRWTPLLKASGPMPAIGQTVLRRDFEGLSWRGEADFYKVYAGLSSVNMKPVGAGTFAVTLAPADTLNTLIISALGKPIYWRVDAVRRDRFGFEAVTLGTVWKVSVLPQGAPEFLAISANAEVTVGVRSQVGPLETTHSLEGTLICKPVSGSIPPGMSVVTQGNAVNVSGAPSRAGHYQAMLQLSLSGSKTTVVGESLLLDITVATLEKAAGTFDGWCENSSFGEGIAALSITQQGHITGKLSMRGTNYTFEAACFDNLTNGYDTIQTDAIKRGSKIVFPIRLSVSMDGRVIASLADEPSANLALFRNNWKDQGMAEIAEQVAGIYPITLPSRSEKQATASGESAKMTVYPNGTFRVTGNHSDGSSFSSSGNLLYVPENETSPARILAVIYGTPSFSPSVFHGIFGIMEIARATEPGGPNTLVEVIPLSGW